MPSLLIRPMAPVKVSLTSPKDTTRVRYRYSSIRASGSLMLRRDKADGASESLANITQRHYAGALSLLKHPGFWQPDVKTCSALKNQGIDAVWAMVLEFQKEARARGFIDSKRSDQNLAWMRQLIDELLRARIREHPEVKTALPVLENSVREASITPLAAATEIVRLGHT